MALAAVAAGLIAIGWSLQHGSGWRVRSPTSLRLALLLGALILASLGLIALARRVPPLLRLLLMGALIVGPLLSFVLLDLHRLGTGSYLAGLVWGGWLCCWMLVVTERRRAPPA